MTQIEMDALSIIRTCGSCLEDIAKQLKIANKLKLIELRAEGISLGLDDISKELG